MKIENLIVSDLSIELIENAVNSEDFFYTAIFKDYLWSLEIKNGKKVLVLYDMLSGQTIKKPTRTTKKFFALAEFQEFSQDVFIIGTADKSFNIKIIDVWRINEETFLNLSLYERIEQMKRIKMKQTLYKNTKDFYQDYPKILAIGQKILVYRITGKPSPGLMDKYKAFIFSNELEETFLCEICQINYAKSSFPKSELKNWQYWRDFQKKEKLLGNYYERYVSGYYSLEPVSLEYFFNLPSSINCKMKDGSIIECKIGLSKEIKEKLKKEYNSASPFFVEIGMAIIDKNGFIPNARIIALKEENQ